LVKESGIVVVVYEKSEGIDVGEVASLFVVSVLDTVHGLLGAEDVSDGVVHWVVEKSGNRSLVSTDIGWVTVENFSHLEDSGSLAILGPEVFWYLWDGIDSDSIESVVIDEVLDPVLELSSDPVVFLVKIWEVCKSAVLNLPLVSPIIDGAIGVVMIWRVEWLNRAEIVSNWGNVVSDNIDHDVDVLIVAGLDKALEVIGRSEVVVGLGPVSTPVAMISWLLVIDNWRDPDGIESHTLDVIEMVDHSLVGTSTVLREVSASTRSVVVLSESIGQDLINSSLLPLVNLSGRGGSKEGSRCNCDFTKHFNLNLLYSIKAN
jgi:hypothetical protein